jgi:hypothetical protein
VTVGELRPLDDQVDLEGWIFMTETQLATEFKSGKKSQLIWKSHISEQDFRC